MHATAARKRSVRAPGGFAWRLGAASVCAVGALTALGAAGAAAAETPLQVTINGKPMTSSGARVSARLVYRGADEWLLTVTNASSNPDGEDITEIDGAVDQAARQQGIVVNRVAAQEADPGDAFVVSPQSGISLTFTAAPVNVCFEPQTPQPSFSCPTMYAAFASGSTEEYVLTTNDTDENLPPLSSIDVKMKIGACAGEVHAPHMASAADDCTLPGVTKIATAKIDKKAGSASFSYNAAHAKLRLLSSPLRCGSATAINSRGDTG